VLKHEMAHQYVDEVVGETGETAHGPAFRRVCEERPSTTAASGLPPRAGPGESGALDAGQERVLGRVAGLLALGQSANLNEAQAAMSAAQRLMLRYNLDAAGAGHGAGQGAARGRAGQGVGAVARGYGFRHLGEPSGRVDESQRVLARLLADHFFVEVIWVPVWRPLAGKAAACSRSAAPRPTCAWPSTPTVFSTTRRNGCGAGTSASTGSRRTATGAASSPG